MVNEVGGGDAGGARCGSSGSLDEHCEVWYDRKCTESLKGSLGGVYTTDGCPGRNTACFDERSGQRVDKLIVQGVLVGCGGA